MVAPWSIDFDHAFSDPNGTLDNPSNELADNEKSPPPRRTMGFLRHQVGVAGFEPTTSWSQNEPRIPRKHAERPCFLGKSYCIFDIASSDIHCINRHGIVQIRIVV